MKRILLFLMIALVLLPAALASCGAYSDEEAAAIIDALLIKEADLNGYLYKDSFRTAIDPGEDAYLPYQKYYDVAPDSKYLTISALRDAIDEVIASTARQEVYDYAFNGTTNEAFSRPPRFAESEDQTLQINVADHDFESMRTVAILGSAKVKRSNKTHIRAMITVERTHADGSVSRDEKQIDVLLEEDGIRRLAGGSMVIGVK